MKIQLLTSSQVRGIQMRREVAVNPHMLAYLQDIQHFLLYLMGPLGTSIRKFHRHI